MICTIKGFGIVNKAEIDVFLELSYFFDDPMDVGNLISGSSAFSKPARTSGSSWFTYCWSLAWRILNITLLACESESENHSVVSNSLWLHGLHGPWNSPGQNTGLGSLSLLQGIFPTQGLNPGPPHCRQILYQLSPTMQETWVRSLGWEDLLEKEMAAHSSILAWKIPWMEESSRLQSMGLQRVRHNWATSLASMLVECNCAVVWAFFGIALLWDWNENQPFPVLWPLLCFSSLLTYWVQLFHSIIF